MNPLRLESTEAEVDALAEVCQRLGGFGADLSVEYVDGWLTALACVARDVPRDEWLPLLTDDCFDRAYGDPQDAAPALAALDARRRVLASQLDPQALDSDPDVLRLAPLMSVWDDTARVAEVAEGHIDAQTAEQLLHTGVAWAEGFRDATLQLGEWQMPDTEGPDRRAFDALLAQVLALLLAPEALSTYVSTFFAGRDPGRDALIDEACYAVQDLRLFWLERAVRTAPRRVQAQPGRNDPCPCGSGRKFKKCHGA